MASAVIFDVDGVLLELTRDEEEIFFQALARFVPTEGLSRDWNSYRIRNDDDIIAEILERNGLPQSLKVDVSRHYTELLGMGLDNNLRSVVVPGAATLLDALDGNTLLGIATANLLGAAQMRLQQVGLWHTVSQHAQGADGGGHKREILARLLDRMAVPRDRVVYVGDNLNDVDAGRQNGVHFIGFSTSAERRGVLRQHGALHTSANHVETLHLIQSLLA